MYLIDNKNDLSTLKWNGIIKYIERVNLGSDPKDLKQLELEEEGLQLSHNNSSGIEVSTQTVNDNLLAKRNDGMNPPSATGNIPSPPSIGGIPPPPPIGGSIPPPPPIGGISPPPPIGGSIPPIGGIIPPPPPIGGIIPPPPPIGGSIPPPPPIGGIIPPPPPIGGSIPPPPPVSGGIPPPPPIGGSIPPPPALGGGIPHPPGCAVPPPPIGGGIPIRNSFVNNSIPSKKPGGKMKSLQWQKIPRQIILRNENCIWKKVTSLTPLDADFTLEEELFSNKPLLVKTQSLTKAAKPKTGQEKVNIMFGLQINFDYLFLLLKSIHELLTTSLMILLKT